MILLHSWDQMHVIATWRYILMFGVVISILECHILHVFSLILMFPGTGLVPGRLLKSVGPEMEFKLSFGVIFMLQQPW